jgi:hypothetical protein
MKQEQIRPAHHQRTDHSRNGKEEGLWPQSAREFLKPPRAVVRDKFDYRAGKNQQT